MTDKKRLRDLAEREFTESWVSQGNKLPKSYAILLTLGKKIAEQEAKLEVLRDELEEAKKEGVRFREQLQGWLTARGFKS